MFSRLHRQSAKHRHSRTLRGERLECRAVPAAAVWDGGGADNHWTTPANWAGGAAPQPGDDLQFPDGGLRRASENDFAAGTAFGSLSLTAGDYSLSGNALSVTGGVTANIPAGASATLALPVGGAGGLAKGGGGTLVLSGANAYTGPTDIRAGVVEADSGTALGATGAGNGTTVASGAALALRGTFTVAEALTFAGGAITPPYDPFQGTAVSPVRVLAGDVTLSGPLALAGDASIAAAIRATLTITGTLGDTAGSTGAVFLYGPIHFTATATATVSSRIISGATLFDGHGGPFFLSPFLGGETLGGNGTVGSVYCSDGVINAGDGSPGVLTINGDLDLGNRGTDTFPAVLLIDLTGPAGQPAADRLDVRGSVILRSPTLKLMPTPGFVPDPFARVQVIGNDGTDPVGGTFAGLPEGAVVQTFDTRVLHITYRGGDGNDVELYATPAPGAVGGTIDAQAFNDLNSNGQYDGFMHAGEPVLSGVHIYVDLNTNGRLDPGEPSGVTDGGSTRFDFAADGTYTLVAEPPSGATPTTLTALPVGVSGGQRSFITFGFHVTVNPSRAQELYAVGADVGGGPHVKVFNADGSLRFSFYAYDLAFTGGVRVATADLDGDGVEDVVTAPGPGGGPHVKVFDGRDGHLVREWMAYDPAFTGGVYVAAKPIEVGQPDTEIITGAGAGGGPHVKVFHSGRTGELFREWMAYDPAFRGGVTVAVGDVNNDGFPDVVTGAGPSGGPHVKAVSGRDGGLILSFYAFDPRSTGGVNVAAGDVNGDGFADIIAGAGAGGGPHVKVFDGRSGGIMQSFYAFDPRVTGGVRVAVADVNGDGRWDLLLGAGAGFGPHVRVLDATTLGEREGMYAFDPAYLGGVFVG